VLAQATVGRLVGSNLSASVPARRSGRLPPRQRRLVSVTFDSAHPVSITGGAPVSADSIELDMIAPASSSDNLLGGLTFDTTGLSEIALLVLQFYPATAPLGLVETRCFRPRRHAYPDAA